ncbi:MAG: hypothetical protein UU14_C0055G0008 [Candidatus Roizmanbacteria bacterium GW2011_GWB1_40_7]|uniref:Fido domain-containing protein n=1 Tax=Candidatus Roizmanbacteria bacterium GW2011_GWB1_40_7 TaxID=1618482 RepID=A0A0G0T661_9BACT|nr:MAG: hypothetical protein UU14_C0055G0008 [Candidatus Roizmanbacteria bacterium GW2011_GWB1_40_7]
MNKENKFYKIEKSNISNLSSDKLSNLLSSFLEKGSEIEQLYQKTYQPNYLYWDEIKYKKLPSDITSAEFWQFVKFIRRAQSTKTSIKSENGKYFTWLRLPGLEEFLHEIDLNMGGHLSTFIGNIDEANKQKFIVRGIMEEAIASSQLEGAHTTREAAKKLLLENRKPRNESEQMILNNYETLQLIENKEGDKKMTSDFLFELHESIARDTISKKEVGRYRTDKEDIIVTDKFGKFIYHQPPKIDFVKAEMQEFFKFANDEIGESFVHPLIKAIMLHFWIGYLHPFTDGNGRMARLMFYWYLLRNDYWAFKYIPLSTKIKAAQKQYGDAYIYSEQDDLDLTYFIDFNIRKIKLALYDFEEYVERKAIENAKMNKLSKTKYKLNERQIQLLQFLHKNKDEKTTTKIYMNINQISRVTATDDLKELKNIGFIEPEIIKKTIFYYGTNKITELFNR